MSTLHEDLDIFLIISCSIHLRMRNVSQKSCKENKNTHFMSNNFFFRKPCLLWDTAEKYYRAERATDDNMARVHCMLDT
jgi:hypothetical protein